MIEDSDGDEGEIEETEPEQFLEPLPTRFKLSIKTSDLAIRDFSSMASRIEELISSCIDLGIDIDNFNARFHNSSSSSSSSSSAENSEISQDDRQTIEGVLNRCEQLDRELSANTAALTRIVDLNGSEHPTETFSLRQEYSKLVDNTPRRRSERARPVEQFRAKLNEARGQQLEEAEDQDQDLGEDVDLVLVNPNKKAVPEKCPFTMMPMENPRRNSACGHIYSEAGALSLLANAEPKRVGKGRTAKDVREIKCPYSGCTKTVRQEWLQRDGELDRALAKQRQQTRQQQQRSATQVESYEV